VGGRSQVECVATRTHSLAELVASSAENTVSPLLARAKLVGLPSGASRALEYPCGVGATTAAFAHSLGAAVGVDPSATSIESAALMHRGDVRCAVVNGGLEAIAGLEGTFDFAYADLRRADRGGAKPETVAAALLGALSPGGMMVLSLALPRGPARLLGAIVPSRNPVMAVRAVIGASGGHVAWMGRGDQGSVLVYALAPPRALRLVG